MINIDPERGEILEMPFLHQTNAETNLSQSQIRPRISYLEDTIALLDRLMPDWRDQDFQKLNNDSLLRKIGDLSTDEADSAVENFKRLYKVFDDSSQNELYYFCLKVIHLYFGQANFNFVSCIKMTSLMENALEIQNEYYRTQILKILVVFLNPNNEDYLRIGNQNIWNYNQIKNKICKLIQYDFEPIFSCKTSYKSMEKMCDQNFFELAFLLKEKFVTSFEVAYKKYVQQSKELFGEFYKIALRMNSRLLYFIASKLGLTATKEFLALKTQDPYIKCSLIAFFGNLDEFYVVFEKSMSKDDGKILKKFKEYVLNKPDGYTFRKVFENSSKIRRLFFGRKNLGSDSIFEKLLIRTEWIDPNDVNDDNDLLKTIWDTFELWDKPEILTMRLSSQKTLVEHILSLKHDLLTIKFLTCPKLYDSERKPLMYMMLNNALLFDHSSKCLIGYHFDLILKSEDNDYENLENMLYFFEELSQYTSKGLNFPFVSIFERILQEKSDEVTENWNPKLPRKHFIMGLMMIYWNCYMEFEEKDENVSKTGTIEIVLKNVENSEKELLRVKSIYIPFFKILSDIIRRPSRQEIDDNFIQNYSDEIIKMERSMEINYNIPNTYNMAEKSPDQTFHFYETFSTNFSYVFLYAAIKTTQVDVVKEVLYYQNFQIASPPFPINMEVGDIHKETALLFLENRYEIGRAVFPKEWITHEILEKFLDSRISQEDNFYKIDCRFMLPYYNYGAKISSKSVDSACFNDDHETMEYILNDQNLKPLITHVVMEFFIRAKMQKYRYVGFTNLLLFLLTYIFPTIILVIQFRIYNHDDGDMYESGIRSLASFDFLKDMNYSWTSFWILIRLVYMIPREIFQLQIIYCWKISIYFWKSSNFVDIILILFPVASFVTLMFYRSYPSQYIYDIMIMLIAINIIFMTFAAIFLTPILKFTIYMKCFVQVMLTYWNIFLIFLPLTIGSAAVVLIIFDKNLGGEVEEFHTFESAVMKYIFMYFGEIGIESQQVSRLIQCIAIIFTFIFLYNLSNLIISIVINDTQEILRQAKLYNLELNAKKYVDFAKSIRIFYIMKIENKKRNEISIIDYIIYKMIKLFMRMNSFANQLQSIYVYRKIGSIYVEGALRSFELNVGKNKYARRISKKSVLMKFKDLIVNNLGGFTVDCEMMKDIQNIINKQKSKNT